LSIRGEALRRRPSAVFDAHRPATDSSSWFSARKAITSSFVVRAGSTAGICRAIAPAIVGGCAFEDGGLLFGHAIDGGEAEVEHFARIVPR